MEKKGILFTPIGIIETPFTDLSGMPIQPSAAEGVRGKVILNTALQEGLQDLEGFSHLILIYYFHQAGDPELLVKPFLDDNIHGVFATRAPRRPNGIGFSIVKLLEIQQNILYIANVDILNGTPLLDIKPYIPYFDNPDADRMGWVEKYAGEIGGKLSDDRFV
ncbi:MAG: tRNA (N6-threonylcarbamoyladenosine(37)-N6)-methyltransferase TrmO [Anaerolineales bacterium]|nr:tRNA (N6-threonylcarbamoyladenosine(37)-N6)-methyltransferase TrmO [Anaerolineales bacterium]